MRATARGENPADEGEPDHQVAGELVRPDHRLIHGPRDDAEHDASEEREKDGDRGGFGQAVGEAPEEGEHRKLGFSPPPCGEGARAQSPWIRSQSPLPHFASNLPGTAARTGLRKLSRSGSTTVMPPFLKVSTRDASWAAISLSCQAAAPSIAALRSARSASGRACQARSFTTTRRGVMMWPVS